MYWIDDYAFYGTNLTGELVLPDGLGPIGQVAFYGSNISKVIFPKTYGNDTDYPACLWTNTFGGDESLSEIVSKMQHQLNYSIINLLNILLVTWLVKISILL